MLSVSSAADSFCSAECTSRDLEPACMQSMCKEVKAHLMFCAWSVVDAGAGVVTCPTLPAPPAAYTPSVHVLEVYHTC